MPAILKFFKLTIIKSLFLLEWFLFVLLISIRGKLKTDIQLLSAVYPFLFFYLIACMLSAISQYRRQLARGGSLYAIAISLILLEQVIKGIVAHTIKVNASVPILDGLLHISNVHNDRGSWIVAFFDMQLETAPLLTHIGLAMIFILGLIFLHRFYVTARRRSLWADVAFLGLFSGYAGYLSDMTTRGYILDFISLPNVVAADLKDIFLAIGLAAFCAEIVDNPELSWLEAIRWRGWKQEWGGLVRFSKEFFRFTIQEMDTFFRTLLRKIGVVSRQD